MASRGVASMDCSGLFLVLNIALSCSVVSSITDQGDTIALQAFRKQLIDSDNHLGNWVGDDACNGWTGVYCIRSDYPRALAGGNTSRVTELRLFQFNLKGQLVPELGNLAALKYLNVMWNQISGSIPSSFGMLKNLYMLLLSGNQLSGVIPDEIGFLTNLNRLQVDQNLLSGPIPGTFQGKNVPRIQHLQMNNNSLNGTIPPGLGSLTTVQHLLLDNNQLTGTLPVEIASLPALVIIQLDNNPFDSGTAIPAEFGRIPTLYKLSLRNCNLGGPIPDFSVATALTCLDLSSNFLTGSIPNGTLSQNLTIIDLSNNDISGTIPDNVGSLPALQFLELRNNSNVGGVIPTNLGQATANFVSNGDSVMVFDFQETSVMDFGQGSNLLVLQSEGKAAVWLYGTPFCSGSTSPRNLLCVPNDLSTYFDVCSPTYPPLGGQSTGANSCPACPSPYYLALESTVSNCKCAIPIIIQWRLISPSLRAFEPYIQQFRSYLSAGLNINSEQVEIQDYVYEPGPRLLLTILFFPTGTQFEDGEVLRIYDRLVRCAISEDKLFGPYELISFLVPPKFHGEEGSGGLSTAAIVGIVVGALTFVVLKTLCMYYVLRAWLLRKSSKGKPKSTLETLKRRLSLSKARSYSSLKVTSVKEFFYEEVAKATDNFSPTRLVGVGGYGKVYSGLLEDGRKVAVKRAEEGSHQGSHEFETEIYLLSRVHHRNLVSLVGYCNDQGEQMLVYEYIAFGSLQHHLCSTARVPLSFVTRLQIALGSARGIHYLHTEADPPIYHRDVKTSNILLDEKFHAKVADFGLSKLAPQPRDLRTLEDGDVVSEFYVSTAVKGTPGYLDPEYFKTHRLTEKSDVYSYGVVLLVIFTGRQPISDGNNLVREVDSAFKADDLLSMVDERIKDSCDIKMVQSLIKLALLCCRDGPAERPTIGQVVRELEQLWKEMLPEVSSDDDGNGVLSGEDVCRSNSEDSIIEKMYRSIPQNSYIEIIPTSSVSSKAWTSSNEESSNNEVTALSPR